MLTELDRLERGGVQTGGPSADVSEYEKEIDSLKQVCMMLGCVWVCLCLCLCVQIGDSRQVCVCAL